MPCPPEKGAEHSAHAPGSPNLCSKRITAGTCSWAASTLVSNPPKGLNKPLSHAFHFGTTLQTTSLMKCWVWGDPVSAPPSLSASGRMLLPCCAPSWAPNDSGNPPSVSPCGEPQWPSLLAAEVGMPFSALLPSANALQSSTAARKHLNCGEKHSFCFSLSLLCVGDKAAGL